MSDINGANGGLQDVPVAEPEHMLAAGLWEDVALPALKKVSLLARLLSVIEQGLPCFASQALLVAAHALMHRWLASWSGYQNLQGMQQQNLSGGSHRCVGFHAT